MQKLILLKLGGSLITDKTQPYTPRIDMMDDLMLQIETTLHASPDPGLRLIIGHGAGSFGHVPASEYRTRDGLPQKSTSLTYNEAEKNYWKGFSEVWYQASALNRFVMEALHKTGLNTMALHPSANVIANDGQVSIWELTSLRMALSAGIVPVIHGDVVFDEVRGGTILSTEDLFIHLARMLNPEHILLAGLEEGVWEDFPARTKMIKQITPDSFEQIRAGVGKSAGADVTGGMESKVKQMLDLVQEIPKLTVQIFSGEKPGNLAQALAGEAVGTQITV